MHPFKANSEQDEYPRSASGTQRPASADYSTGLQHAPLGYSTLEFDVRGQKTAPDLTPTLDGQAQAPQAPHKPWWRRYWILLLIATILIAAAIVGGSVGGTLATRSSTPAQSSTASSTLPHSSSSRTLATATPTATPSPSDIPQHAVYFADLTYPGINKISVAFLDDDSADKGCRYGVNDRGAGEDCSNVMLLPDGFEYVLSGCPVQLWVGWRNPQSGSTGFKKLGDCERWPEDQLWRCPDGVVTAKWYCKNGNGTKTG